VLALCGAAVVALVLAWPCPQAGAAVAGPQPGGVTATVSECLPAGEGGESDATFTAEMTAIPGSARMEIRFELQELRPGQTLFHTVVAPGLSAWRLSAPSVHTYRYLRQVTNLTAASSYRAEIHFRWLDARGYVIHRSERLTPRCSVPAAAPPGTAEAPGS
jgi:hypothetical protein